MFPVLISVGEFNVSTFGVFFALAFFTGLFLIWRLAKAWDLDEERILDLTILTLIGAFVFARAYFVIENWQYFGSDPAKWILFYKYSGFSFWGGFLGGWLTLTYLTKRFKVDFWLSADIAIVGMMGALILTDLGCFFAACNIGVPSNSFMAVSMVGIIGKRMPVQLFEAALILILVWRVWSKATHFHKPGMIIAVNLVMFSLIKLVLTPMREEKSTDYLFLTALLVLGLVIFYKITGRNIVMDIKVLMQSIVKFFLSSHYRSYIFQLFSKWWYNLRVALNWKIKNLVKFLKKKNVKLSHKDSEFN